MRLLLDTHALLWWWTDSPRLSTAARAALIDPENDILVSAVSAWELATKHRAGRLPELGDAVARFGELVVADGFSMLTITAGHALLAGAHPAEHRDPFDRMLAAQSQIEGVPLVTLDTAFAHFDIRTLW